MCAGYGCSRNALAALNILYILVAFILIGVAAYAKALAYVSNLAAIGGIIACGVFLLLTALVGLIGAIKHHQVCLFFYMIILFLLFILQFALACACLALNKEQQQTLADTAWKSFSVTDKQDLQRGLDCCGYKDVDNLNATNPDSHPICNTTSTCCPKTSKSACCVGVEDSDGTACPCKEPNRCFTKITQHMGSALKITGGVGLFFSFTEFFGVFMTVRYRNQRDPKSNPSAFL